MMRIRDYLGFRRDGSDGYRFDYSITNPYEDEDTESHDHMLHLTLSEIFSERRLSSDQIKELLRVPADDTDQDSIFKLILEREPALGDAFPKNSKLSLLWMTVLCCYQNSAELLVRSGADVNELYGRQYYAGNRLVKEPSILHALVIMHPSAWSLKFINLVLEHGADLNARDTRGQTPLLLATLDSRVKKLIKLFLEKGADVNVQDHFGHTPLLAAAERNDVAELLPLLIKHRADVTARNEFGGDVWSCLAEAPGEHADLARLLIAKGAPLEHELSEVSCQTIHFATSRGENKLVELFLDHGVDENARMNSKEGTFPLYLAVGLENPAVLLTLLKRGANIDLKTKIGGRSALHRACEYPNVESIRILLSVGADMFAEDRRGKTPLDVLISRGDLEHPGIKLMLKTLAIRKARQLQWTNIESEQDELIRIKASHPTLWTYYQDCRANIRRIKSTMLTETSTFFDFLTECHCQIAALMGNSEFETNYRHGMQDSYSFFIYAKDIRDAFERAQHSYQHQPQQYYPSLLKLEDMIREAVYYVLPHVVARKVARYMLENCCEDCGMKIVSDIATWLGAAETTQIDCLT